MTQPAEPTPGAPAAEPTREDLGYTDAQVTRMEQEAATGPAPAAEDISSLPDWAQKQLRDARAEAAKSRTTAKQNAAAEARAELTAQLAKALGLAEDEPVDPAELTSQIEHAQSVAWRNGVELQVFRAAGSLGANPEALLDSMSFIDSLDDLVDEDPRSPEFTEALKEKVAAALERNPGYRAAQQATGPAGPRPDPSQGARGAGPDVDSRIAEATRKGDWRTVISLQNEKLTKL